MPTAFDAIEGWIDEVRTKLENGGIQKGDLDQLYQIISANRRIHDSDCSTSMRQHRASALKSSVWRYTSRWRAR